MHLLVLWYLDWVILIKIMSSYLLHINGTKDPPYYNIKELSTLSILQYVSQCDGYSDLSTICSPCTLTGYNLGGKGGREREGRERERREGEGGKERRKKLHKATFTCTQYQD